MKIEGNLNDVKELETLKTGVYSAMVLKEPQFVTSSQKKTPGLEFEFTFMDPGTEIAPGVPRVMRNTIYKSASVGWVHFKMKEVCEACGVALDNPDTAEFVNTTLKLAISEEPYTDKHGNAKVRNQIDNYLKA